MRVLVAYASQFGSTREIAERVADGIAARGLTTELLDVARVDEIPDLGRYDAFIVGSAVHAGHWLTPATDFVRRNSGVLSRWPVWMFSSGPLGDRGVAAPQPDPHELAEFRHAFAIRGHRVFAGSFDRSMADTTGMGIVERTVVKRFLPDGDWRNWPEIDAWAADIEAELLRLPVPA
jgi:menaquinone-dependent protoporphyrinogen oxidase